jgi:hypothetical protein
MTGRLTDADRIALKRAVAIARLDPVEAKRIDTRLAEGDNYWEIAEDCSHDLQHQNLELAPWELPPCCGDIDGGGLQSYRQAAELMRKMLSLGLSKFEPQPSQAMEQARTKRVATAK